MVHYLGPSVHLLHLLPKNFIGKINILFYKQPLSKRRGEDETLGHAAIEWQAAEQNYQFSVCVGFNVGR